MSPLSSEATHGSHFTAAALGEFVDLHHFTFTHPAVPFEVEGKVFLNALLGLTSSEISLNKLPPNMSVPFLHTHTRNEEIYIFIKGKGEFQVDGHIFPIGEGSVVRVAPEGERCWRNLSAEPLYYIVVQAPAGEYHGSTISDGKAVQKPIHWEPKVVEKDTRL